MSRIYVNKEILACTSEQDTDKQMLESDILIFENFVVVLFNSDHVLLYPGNKTQFTCILQITPKLLYVHNKTIIKNNQV